MQAAVRQGESGGRPGRPLPRRARLARGLLGCILLLGGGWLPAHAAALYRCTGPQGETVFASRPDGYGGCRAVAEDAGAAAPAPTAAAPARPGRWQYRDQPAPGGARATAPAAPAAGQAGAAAKTARVLRGSVYRVTRPDGSVEYTNIEARAHGGTVKVLFTYIATCAACDVHSTIDWAHTPLKLTAYRDEIARAAADSGVDAGLLRAIIHAESAFNPYAVSRKGAQGLMQLMPGTAGEVGVADAFDPAQNIRGGAQYLAQLLQAFHGDERLAAAAFNAGAAAVRKYGDVPPYDETQVYVQRVALLARRYREALGLAVAGGSPAQHAASALP
ncbi:lytic murein transglycosylase [Mizugakiibacter sediminis]|uniref:Lytic murein transglycosylase n=1 Tax=Mizugakiibacter sediminis TaxID=1475481 RepID=A0A0K8QJ77_9GAMM|nr:lytic transglycosylase domain-containing protein [Mizugakiibacter sediminis]GAP64995.1 lytic murein transglycosylase [Mizugakiibacter sediminis]